MSSTYVRVCGGLRCFCSRSLRLRPNLAAVGRMACPDPSQCWSLAYARSHSRFLPEHGSDMRGPAWFASPSCSSANQCGLVLAPWGPALPFIA
jgi:hypothetical protein